MTLYNYTIWSFKIIFIKRVVILNKNILKNVSSNIKYCWIRNSSIMVFVTMEFVYIMKMNSILTTSL